MFKVQRMLYWYTAGRVILVDKTAGVLTNNIRYRSVEYFS